MGPLEMLVLIALIALPLGGLLLVVRMVRRRGGR
jgi:hypothetical protein